LDSTSRKHKLSITYKKKIRKQTDSFKAAVVMEALKERETLAQQSKYTTLFGSGFRA